MANSRNTRYDYVLCAISILQEFISTRVIFMAAYAPVLKANTVRLLVAMAATHGAHMYRYDTYRAFLNGDVEENLFTRAPDWWPELVPEVYCLQLKKNNTIALLNSSTKAGNLRRHIWGKNIWDQGSR
jgi:hypothetical protein